jgi:hypothetical protein
MAPQFDRAPRDLLRTAGCIFVRQGLGSHEICTARSPSETSLCRSAFRVAILPTPSCAKPACPRRSDRPMRASSSTFRASPYDGSPIILPNGTSPPADSINDYVPSACPGGFARICRPPPTAARSTMRSASSLRCCPWARGRPMRPLFATAAQALGIPRAVADVAGEEARGATGHYDTYCLHFRIGRLRARPPYWLGQPCVGSRHKPFIRSPRRHASALTAVLRCRAPWLS